jgi:hypothetical protein
MRRVSIRLSSAIVGVSLSLEDDHENGSRGGLMTCSKFLVMTLMLVLVQLCPVCAQPASTTAGCKEESARFAVGEPYSDELAERARRAAGAGVVRKTVPGGADTMELRADRLNLDVDRNGRIQRVRCG